MLGARLQVCLSPLSCGFKITSICEALHCCLGLKAKLELHSSVLKSLGISTVSFRVS